MQLRPGEMPLLRQMILQLTGVSLDDSKAYLVETRLGPVAEKYRCQNFNEFYFRLRYGTEKALIADTVDAITTHETSFFRDAAPFDALQFKILPEVIDAREALRQPKRLRIWSAACSTGQEPYSIAMVLRELLGDAAGWNIEIVATDIAQATLEQARRGLYSAHDVQRTARPQFVAKYFEGTQDGYRVADKVRPWIQWRQQNLLEPFAGLGQFDVVFLRNVLIYFEPEQRRGIANRVADALLPHGWLVVGGSENLTDAGPRFRAEMHCRALVYQPNRTPAPAR